MTEIIAIIMLIAVLGGAAGYLIRQKKKGAKCIGCPYANECAKKSCK